MNAPNVAPKEMVAHSLGPDLLWRALHGSAPAEPRPAVFLDRDGVIIEDLHYLSDPGKVFVLPGIAGLIQVARARGYRIVCLTNQAGIGLGYFGWSEFAAIEARIANLLAEHDCHLDATFACPFHPEGRPPYNRPHPWRKPNPGMLFEAARRLNVQLPRSVLIGDRTSDVLAARAAGLPAAAIIWTARGTIERQEALATAAEGFAVYAFGTVEEATALLSDGFLAS